MLPNKVARHDRWPQAAAKCNADLPSRSWNVGLAPLPTRSSTLSWCPCTTWNKPQCYQHTSLICVPSSYWLSLTALKSAGCWSSSTRFVSAPYFSNITTQSLWPADTPNIRGVLQQGYKCHSPHHFVNKEHTNVFHIWISSIWSKKIDNRGLYFFIYDTFNNESGRIWRERIITWCEVRSQHLRELTKATKN